MASKRAKVTLVGPLSLATGRYRFTKGVPVIVDDPKLLDYCKASPDFRVAEMPDAEPARKARAETAPAKKQKPVAKPESKPEESKAAEEASPRKVKPEDESEKAK